MPNSHQTRRVLLNQVEKNWKMKSRHGNWNIGFLHRFQMKFNMFCNLLSVCNQFKSVNLFFERNNFKPCLIEQCLNMFNVWCEKDLR